jgi:hypothetical protein
VALGFDLEAHRALGLPLLDALHECVFVQRAGEWRVRIPTDAACSLTVFEPRPALTLAVALIGRSRSAKHETAGMALGR